MTSPERKAYITYCKARIAYDEMPNYGTATALLQAATALCEISDDYQHLLDEADDIMADPI